MSNPPRRKRAAEDQLSRDDGNDDGDGMYDSRTNETFDTTPQIASAEEMKDRRVVRVVRPAGTTPASNTGGFFKGLSTSAPGAPASSGTSTTNSACFDSKNPFGVAFSTNIAPAFGASKPSFGFGSSTATAATADGKTAGPTSTAAAPGFNFGTNTAAEGTSAAPKAFNFGFGTAVAVEKKEDEKTASANGDAPAKTEGGGVSSEDTKAPKKVFGSSAGFSFSSAVGSFVEARKKMEADAPATDATTTESTAAPSASDTADTHTLPALAKEQDVESLLRAPAKLFLWKKEGDQSHWVESGVGDAQLVKQLHSTPEEPEKKSFIYRLLVRDGYSLNVLASKGHMELGTAKGKQLTLTTLASEGSSTYAMRFSGPTGEDSAKQFSDKLSELLK